MLELHLINGKGTLQELLKTPDQAQKPASTVAIREEKLFDFVVYPNPNNGQFRVKSNVMPDNVLVYNSQGKVLYQVKPDELNFSIDLLGIESGMYVIELGFKDHAGREKILVY